MPYRRLPNTDQARLRALRTAIQLADKQNYGEQVVLYKTIHEAKTYLNGFEKQLVQYQQTLESQVSANKRYQQIVHNARLYISHFIQVFNLSMYILLCYVEFKGVFEDLSYVGEGIGGFFGLKVLEVFYTC